MAIGVLKRSGCHCASAVMRAGSKLDIGGLALNQTVPAEVGTRATTEYGLQRARAGPVRVRPACAHWASIQSSASASDCGSCHGGMPRTRSGAFRSASSTCRSLVGDEKPQPVLEDPVFQNGLWCLLQD